RRGLVKSISPQRKQRLSSISPQREQGISSLSCAAGWSGNWPMFTLSAFADEIDPDPQVQIDVLKSCGVRHIEFRSIHKTNVLALSDLQAREFKSLLDANGFKLSAIGSPIGKTVIDQPFEIELKRLQRAIELCHLFDTRNIRIFSYYLTEGGEWDD